MPATLKDVAKLAGVSVATASRVLNNPEKVAEQSRNKVLAAIEELGYSSNLLAKSLREDRLDAVYVLLPSLSDPFFAEMHQGILDVLTSYDHYMISAVTEGNQELELGCLSKARVIGPAGVLLYTRRQNTVKALASGKFDFPVLLLSGNQIPSCGHLLSLETDREKIGTQAAKHLTDQGCRRLLYLCEDPGGIDAEFWRGIRSAAKAAGAECQWHQAAHASLDAGRALDEYWKQAKLKPDGILAGNCLQAAGVLTNLRAAGVCVPEQVSVISLENAAVAGLTTPQLSTAGPSGYQIGMRGAAMLLDRVRGQSQYERTLDTTLDTKLIARGTTRHG